MLSRDYQTSPARHEAQSVRDEGPPASHHFWLVDHHERVRHAADLIAAEGQSIVFTRTRHGADRLAKQLGRLGVNAVALHGGRSQNQRTKALKAFAGGGASALIATDVAARGIHVDQVAAVIHFDMPGDAKDYLHRSGRTARAGAGGRVVSFVTEAQRRDVRRMQRQLDLEVGFQSPDPVGSPAQESPPAKAPPRHPHSDAQSLYVANLPWRVTSHDLAELFSPFGSVEQSTIITDRRSGRSRGFGFVDMSRSAADDAVRALHGSSLDGRDITVRRARPRGSRR